MLWSAKHGSLINTTFIFWIYPYVSSSCQPSVYSMCKYFFTHFFCTCFLLHFIVYFIVFVCDIYCLLCFLSTWLNWIIACFALGSQQSPGCVRAAPGLFGGQKGQRFHCGQQVGSTGMVFRISMISLTIFYSS